jgi:polyisoprenoid-binding protein YceI
MLGAMRRGQGRLHVFTFKDGMLSAVAHDLRLRLDAFEVTLDGSAVRAELDLRALSVEGPVTSGSGEVAAYDARQRADVEKAMHGEVLHTNRNPRAIFQGTAAPDAAGFRVEGQLELAGKLAPLAFSVVNQEGGFAARFELQPSRWGIAPYKAMLGAIRVKDSVRVELSVSEG